MSGTATKRDAYHYQGGFNNRMFEGQGEIRYDNGDTYQGEWSMDLPEGHGKYVSKCFTMEGKWDQGLLVDGMLSTTGGLSFVGTFMNGLPEEGTFQVNNLMADLRCNLTSVHSTTMVPGLLEVCFNEATSSEEIFIEAKRYETL